ISLSYLSKTSGIPPSTVHRELTTLMKCRYVQQDKISKEYALGSRLVELGLRARESMDVRSLAHPIMMTLTEKTEETSYLTIRNGYFGVYIEKIESNQNLQLFEPLGATVPLHIGASRKILLAEMPDDFIDEMKVHGVLYSSNSDKQNDVDNLKIQLEKIRKNGFAISQSENIKNAT